MSVITEELWNKLYLLMSRLSKDALTKISFSVTENRYISNYSDYPQSVSKDKSWNWPTVNELSPFAGLTFGEHDYQFADYSSLLTVHKTDEKIRVSDLDGYDECSQFLKDTPQILSLIWYRDTSDDIEIAICLFLGNIINRYIALTRTYDYEESNFREIYTSVTNVYFLKILEFDICVPILFIKFDCDNFSISDNVYITKMTEDFIRSKHFIGHYDARFEKLVLDCATHMLVIKGYHLENKEIKSEEILGNWQAYPIEIVDSVFASIRAITNLPTGYAQIISLPTNNWIPRHCKGNLIGLTGAKAKEYPNFFLEYFWLNPHNSVTVECSEKIVSLASALLKTNHNAFKLACNRLNRSMLRNCEEDTILDAIIGLELLLSDNDKGELTYKISSRMATISTLYANCPYSPVEVQQSVSKIYRYRSDIVHSRNSRPATKLIKINQGEEIEPVALAIKYLSMAIEILVFKPEFLTSKKIDELMMKKLQ